MTAGVDLHPAYKETHRVKNVVCARNTAVIKAIQSDKHFEHFVFLDRDVRPGKHTDAFLHLSADVKSCQVPMREVTAWSQPTSFHEAIWSTSRAVLESLKPPYFMMRYNETGTKALGCLCLSFREQVLAAGYSIAHGGWAEHDRDESWC